MGCNRPTFHVSLITLLLPPLSPLSTQLYVIGGGTPNPIVGELISMYSFDFNTLRWDAIYPAENAAPDVDWPFSRRSHTCVAYDVWTYRLLFIE